jgi:tetratricopeptide (TPR) repeat protein
LATLCSNLGQYAESERYCKIAEPLLVQEFGGDSPEYAGALNNLAWSEEMQNNFAAAFEHLQAAFEIMNRKADQNDLLVAIVASNLAQASFRLGKMDLAVTYCKKAADIFASRLGTGAAETKVLREEYNYLLRLRQSPHKQTLPFVPHVNAAANHQR